MDDVLNRIKKLMEKEGLSPSEMADSIDIGRPLLSHVMSGRNKPSLHLVLKILEHFPTYSADWLLLGSEKTIVAAPQKEIENEVEIEQEETPKPNKPIDLKSSITGQNKDLDNIILMYNDKTFDVYKPR